MNHTRTPELRTQQAALEGWQEELAYLRGAYGRAQVVQSRNMSARATAAVLQLIQNAKARMRHRRLRVSFFHRWYAAILFNFLFLFSHSAKARKAPTASVSRSHRWFVCPRFFFLSARTLAECQFRLCVILPQMARGQLFFFFFFSISFCQGAQAPVLPAQLFFTTGGSFLLS